MPPNSYYGENTFKPIPKMNPKAIVVEQVENGYAVRYRSDAAELQENTTFVFQSFSELAAWLAEHFTHRNFQVNADRTSG